MSLAERRKVMHAASSVSTHNVREAAIVGGILRCVIATERYETDFIARYAHEIVGVFKLVGVDRTPPCSAEIDMILRRFEEVGGAPVE